ncbi:hypothetical protein LTR17_005726 [Elasticomyces elasticus]|nr:hypothetical protein LTR17_005726 [Elasticomyces elasticus]
MAESHNSQDELARKDSIEDIGEQMEELNTDEAHNAKRDRERDNRSSSSLEEALGLNDAVATPIRPHNFRDIAIGVSQPLDSPQRLPDYEELNKTPNAQLTVEATHRRIEMADDVLARNEKDTSPTTRRKFLMWRELTREKRSKLDSGEVVTYSPDLKILESDLCDYVDLHERWTSAHYLLEGALSDKKRYEIYARWGDYLADNCGTLRTNLQQSGHMFPAQRWTKISEDMKAEEIKLRNFESRMGLVHVTEEEKARLQPVTEGVRQVAQGLGWEFEVAKFSIHEYSERNKLVHCDIFRNVERQDWNAIGEKCEEDLSLLASLYGATQDESRTQWKEVIEGFCKKWVYRRDVHSAWRPLAHIRKASEDLDLSLASVKKVAEFCGTEEERDAFIEELSKQEKSSEIMREKTERQREEKIAALENEVAEVQYFSSAQMEEACRRIYQQTMTINSLEGDVTSLKHDQDKLKAEAERMKKEMWRMNQTIKSQKDGLAALKKWKEDHASEALVVPEGF